MLSNARTYLSIATDALAESERLDAAARRPKPNGETGFIVTIDPEQRAFKQSLVAIVFAGVYFEALLYIVGVERLGGVTRFSDDDLHKDLGLVRLALVPTASRGRQHGGLSESRMRENR
ncbi:MAG: hypothetical protein AB7G13_17235 [Lautropia sp.]